MKQIKRLQGEVKELQKRASSCLNTIDGNTFSEKFEDVIKELADRKSRLLVLKNGVMVANIQGNVFKKILELGELKSHIDFLRELNPQVAIVDNGYRAETTKHVSQWTVAEKNAAVQKTQQRINDLTDELDDFNAKTDIIQ
jgi:hypothetical protein